MTVVGNIPGVADHHRGEEAAAKRPLPLAFVLVVVVPEVGCGVFRIEAGGTDRIADELLLVPLVPGVEPDEPVLRRGLP